jgi:hypothetical protein
MSQSLLLAVPLPEVAELGDSIIGGLTFTDQQNDKIMHETPIRVPEANHVTTVCFKKSFTTLKTYINLLREHVQCFELS